MKLKIKVKELEEGCMPNINPIGDYIDLRSAINITLAAPQSATLKAEMIDGIQVKHRDVTIETYYIPLGVAIKLPKGFEAELISRSSTPKKMGLFIPSGLGLIDNSFCSNGDEWHYVCSPMRDTSIRKGDRICQFRIKLSQKATFFQKLKWLFSSGVKIVQVDNLGGKKRGGLGSTGIK